MQQPWLGADLRGWWWEGGTVHLQPWRALRRSPAALLPTPIRFDGIFGSAFNTNGLGGVLTCGVSGVAAGLRCGRSRQPLAGGCAGPAWQAKGRASCWPGRARSHTFTHAPSPHPLPRPAPPPRPCSHAPISRSSGKERYVFFSMPHISIDAKGRVGAISRPGRPGVGCACGALAKALVDIQKDGLTSNCKIPGGEVGAAAPDGGCTGCGRALYRRRPGAPAGPCGHAHSRAWPAGYSTPRPPRAAPRLPCSARRARPRVYYPQAAPGAPPSL